MVIEISVAIIAIAFVALVFYLIALIKRLIRTLHQVDQTLIVARKELDEISVHAKKVFEHTNAVSFDLKHKMESLDSVFNTLSNIGSFFQQKTAFLKRNAQKEHHFTDDSIFKDDEESEYRSTKINSLMELAASALRFWKKFKKRR